MTGADAGALRLREVRTFKLRRGRVTPGQADALDRLWPAFGLTVAERAGAGARLDLARLFGRVAPVVLEIGSGMGEATAELAAAQPERDVLAVDVHTPGLGSLLRHVEQRGLTNVRVADGDALVLLRDLLAPGTLHEVRVFFPDPWPKARHAKRRLVTPEFAELVADRLHPGGILHVATDWTPYAEQVLAVLGTHPAYALLPEAPARARTRFERRGIDAGRRVHDVAARRR